MTTVTIVLRYHHSDEGFVDALRKVIREESQVFGVAELTGSVIVESVVNDPAWIDQTSF